MQPVCRPRRVARAHAVARLDAAGHAGRRTQHLTEILPLLDVLASLYALRPWLGGRAAALAARRHAGRDGLAHRDGALLVRDDDARGVAAARRELWRGLLAESPGHVAELTLLAHCGAALPDVLNGAKDGARLLSPTGQPVEQLCRIADVAARARVADRKR